MEPTTTFLGVHPLVTLHNNVVYAVYYFPADSLGGRPTLVGLFSTREKAEKYASRYDEDYMVGTLIQELKVEG